MSGAGNHKRSLLPSTVILAFVLAYLAVGAFTLDATTRTVPLLAGGVTLLLLLADIIRVATGRGHDDSGHAEGGGVKTGGVTGEREIIAIGIVAAATAGVYVFGFYVAIPLYLFASVAFLGKLSFRTALIVAVATSAVVFLVFEILLAYNLHRGVLFS